MIEIKIKKSKDKDEVIGFHMKGHAGFSESGTDIVCAGVSALVINCINSIDVFTNAVFDLKDEEESGNIDFTVKSPIGDAERLLFSSLILGLHEIEVTYGNEYVVLN